MADEPMADEPMADEPMADEPIADEPIAVSEGGGPVHDPVEVVGARQVAHISGQVVDIDAEDTGIRPRPVEEDLGRVEAGDLAAASGQAIGDRAVPAGQVQHPHCRLEAEQPPDQVGAGVAPLSRRLRAIGIRWTSGRGHRVGVDDLS
jgi:hypothetical protein